LEEKQTVPRKRKPHTPHTAYTELSKLPWKRNQLFGRPLLFADYTSYDIQALRIKFRH
jgi:hypothetical protein